MILVRLFSTLHTWQTKAGLQTSSPNTERSVTPKETEESAGEMRTGRGEAADVSSATCDTRKKFSLRFIYSFVCFHTRSQKHIVQLKARRQHSIVTYCQYDPRTADPLFY